MKIYILLLLTTFSRLGSFQETCSLDVTCITGKCCGPYSLWDGDYTCCPDMTFCGSAVCISYWAVIAPCIIVGTALICTIIALILARKRRIRRNQQQQLLHQQNPQPQINQPQIYYVPQSQQIDQQYQQGQPVYYQAQPYQTQYVNQQADG